MHKNVEDIMLELKVKRAVRQEIREMRVLLKEDSGGFLAPFKDVLKALRLVAMDISNSLRLVISSVITFDSVKMQEKIKAFDDRRQKINTEWRPIIEAAENAIGSTDPILKMAILGPANFFALQGLGAGLVAGKTVAEVVTATNWNEIINSYSPQLDLNQSLNRFFLNWKEDAEERNDNNNDSYDSYPRGDVRRKRSRTMDKLAHLFTESVNLQEQDEKSQPRMTEKEAIDKFVQASGMDRAFEDLRKKSLNNLKDTCQSLLADIEPAVATSQLFAAKDVNELGKAFQLARQQNPKIDITSYDKFVKTVTDESMKLQKDKKFIDKMIKESGKQSLTPEELKNATDKLVFTNAKSDFDKKTVEGLKKVVNTTEESIKDLKIDNSILTEMKKNSEPESQEATKVYENLLNVYNRIKSDLGNR